MMNKRGGSTHTPIKRIIYDRYRINRRAENLRAS